MSAETGNLQKIIRRKKPFSFWIIENISYGSLPHQLCGRLQWHSLSAFGASLRPSRCLRKALSRRPKLSFGPEKLINPTIFVEGGNDTANMGFMLVTELRGHEIHSKLPLFFPLSRCTETATCYLHH